MTTDWRQQIRPLPIHWQADARSRRKHRRQFPNRSPFAASLPLSSPCFLICALLKHGLQCSVAAHKACVRLRLFSDARRHTFRLQPENQPRNFEPADRNVRVLTTSCVNPFHHTLVSMPWNSCSRHITRVFLSRVSQPRLSIPRPRRKTPQNPRDEP